MNAISHNESIEPQPEAAPSQAGLERLILPPPVSLVGSGQLDIEAAVLGRLKPGTVLMMGDNPALPKMPARPKLLDFFKYRFTDITVRHLLTSGKRALDDGHDDKIVLACLLHDIANGCLLRSDHGYWGAQLIAPVCQRRDRVGGAEPPGAALLRRRIGWLQVPGIVRAFLRPRLPAARVHPPRRRGGARSIAGT